MNPDSTVKMSKDEVNYGSRDPGEQCGGCRHYKEEKCNIVEGDIKPEMGCDLFEPIITLTAKYTQNPDFPEPNIDIVTGEKKKTGFYSLIHTQIGSMISMLDRKLSQTGSQNLRASLNTLLTNNMKLQMRHKITKQNLRKQSSENVKKLNELDERIEKIQTEKELLLNDGMREGSLISFQTGKLQTGAMSDQFKSADGGQYVSYFLLNDKENLKHWGVTSDSIPRHIASFKGMPFTITSKKFFPNSPYGEVTNHPSTDHFKDLGIILGGIGPMSRPREFNDLVQQAKFQEEFRVGNIEDVFQKDNGDWHALIKILPQFADMQMPNLVSPALFQINKDEPANAITSWVGMHLTGLDEKPAYGNNAIYTGSCWGTSKECLTKLSASMRDIPFIPCFKSKMASMNLNLAKIRLNLLSAAMISSDHTNIERENQLCIDPSGESIACNINKTKHEI